MGDLRQGRKRRLHRIQRTVRRRMADDGDRMCNGGELNGRVERCSRMGRIVPSQR